MELLKFIPFVKWLLETLTRRKQVLILFSDMYFYGQYSFQTVLSNYNDYWHSHLLFIYFCELIFLTPFYCCYYFGLFSVIEFIIINIVFLIIVSLTVRIININSMSISISGLHVKMFHLIKLRSWFELTEVQVYARTQTEKCLFHNYK